MTLTRFMGTSMAAGQLMLNLLASASRWERETIGERPSLVLSHKRRNRRGAVRLSPGAFCSYPPPSNSLL